MENLKEILMENLIENLIENLTENPIPIAENINKFGLMDND